MYTITGKEFRDMCRGAGLGLEDMSEESGISTNTISNWHNDNRDIKLKNYNKLVKAYDDLTEKDDD